MATWPSTFTAGQVVTAAQLNGIQALGAGWTSFTPTLSGSGGNPTGQTYTGSAWVQAGQLVFFRALITLGSGLGSGAYSVTLPTAPKASVIQSVRGFVVDTGTGYYDLTALVGSPAQLMVQPSTAGAVLRNVTPTVPITFAAGDQIVLEGFYEAA